MNITIADILSFCALFFSWTGLIFLINGSTQNSIFLNLIALIFDFFDGFVARRKREETVLGRHIDSYSDIFIYLVFPSIIYVKFLSPSILTGIAVSFIVILTGGLRLIIFNTKGILFEKGKMYYSGLPVFYVLITVLFLYSFRSLNIYLISWLTTLFLLIVSPLMLSRIKISKSSNPFIFILFLLIFVLLNYINL